MIKVLFVCSKNSARSQMACAYLNQIGKGKYFAESAGLEAGELNPYVVKVMQEDGIDISNNTTNNVFQFFKEGRSYDYVITVCDFKTSEKCPIFPGRSMRLHWDLEDPAKVEGTEEEKLEKIRAIRDKIKNLVNQFFSDRGFLSVTQK